jgi:hypothetical protein
MKILDYWVTQNMTTYKWRISLAKLRLKSPELSAPKNMAGNAKNPYRKRKQINSHLKSHQSNALRDGKVCEDRETSRNKLIKKINNLHNPQVRAFSRFVLKTWCEFKIGNWI